MLFRSTASADATSKANAAQTAATSAAADDATTKANAAQAAAATDATAKASAAQAYAIQRGNHTGTQTAATISDFTAAVIAVAPPTTNASLLTSGTLNDQRLSSNVVLTGDSRLTNSRSPTSHSSTHGVSGSDPVTVAISQVTGLQSSLDGKQVAGSYATLDGTGRVPASQLPSYVDDVVEYSSLSSFPASASAETVKIGRAHV